MQNFSHLSSSELQILTETPLYVGLLIAYADGNADDKEIEWIEKVTSFRTKTAHHSLRAFYAKAHEFAQSNSSLVRSDLSGDTDQILNSLSDKIARAKEPLAKLDENVRERLLDSFQSLATSVAEISGGLMNFFAQNPAEEKWLGLDMLQN